MGRLFKKQYFEHNKPSTVTTNQTSNSNSSEDGERTLNGNNVLHQTQTGQSTAVSFGPDYDLPRMRGFNLWHRKWSVFAYATFILMCNLAAPCILYYVLKDHTNLSGHALLGISSATLGISSSFDNPFRMWKLWKHRDLYGPLNDHGPKWHLDWTQHLYSFALFPIFAIPLAISSSVNPPLYHFFNYSLPMLFSVPGIFFLVSLFKPRVNFWVSSDPPGTPLKPGVFYLFEDIGAVDFRHGKDFRRQLHARYAASPVYRDLMWWQTVFWTYGTVVYFATSAAVNHTTPFWFSYGFVLGLAFLWLVIWAFLSILIAKYFHKKENTWLALKKKGDAERALAMTLEGADQIATERSNIRRSQSHSRRMSERGATALRQQIRTANLDRSMTENAVADGDAEVNSHQRGVEMHPTTHANAQQPRSPTSPTSPRSPRFHDFNPGVPAVVSADPMEYVRTRSAPQQRP